MVLRKENKLEIITAVTLDNTTSIARNKYFKIVDH